MSRILDVDCDWIVGNGSRSHGCPFAARWYAASTEPHPNRLVSGWHRYLCGRHVEWFRREWGDILRIEAIPTR